MAQTTKGSKHNILETLERALDDSSEYIGETVWKELNDAYERVDDDVIELQEEFDNATRRIAELEQRIEELERDAS